MNKITHDDQVKENKAIKKGNFFYLFSHPKLVFKYLNIILIAVPVWFVMYFLVQFAPEMCKALGMKNGPGKKSAGKTLRDRQRRRRWRLWCAIRR